MEGVILKRRNRFIMEVEVEGGVNDCHCPTKGRIGNIVFRNISCLLSKSNDTNRESYPVKLLYL
ncbi:hypothetical protein ACFY5J_06395 [Peribacillus butanolivorans]|uniref:hypothetical protein n=1 Tax=Peribacillus butanolivorans TaxID=421767 RepID=UPI00366D6BC5